MQNHDFSKRIPSALRRTLIPIGILESQKELNVIFITFVSIEMKPNFKWFPLFYRFCRLFLLIFFLAVTVDVEESEIALQLNY